MRKSRSKPADRLDQRAAARFEAWLASSASKQDTWQAWFDGSAQGGMGAMAAGGFVLAPQGDQFEIVVPLAQRGCNNEAEYQGLLAVLDLLTAQGALHVTLYGDSDLVIRQARGEQADKALRLAPLKLRAQQLIGSFQTFSAHWIPRHKNSRADKLAAEGFEVSGPTLIRHQPYQAIRPQGQALLPQPS
ncbi:MAG: ribonuclease HI family protein [Pseudomonadota bacterium]